MAAIDGTDKTSTAKTTTTEADSARIGWAFLSQYYSYLNKDPARLHCFYTKRSTLIHSTEGEDSTPCYGQQEIHAKIMSLQFDDCKVYISNVDSQGSAEHGIIVQVIGEMSNANGPWRKFAQTFFLAEQLNGYFVLNDICRYIKEEGDDEAAHTAQADERAAENGGAEPASVQSVLFNNNEASGSPVPVSKQEAQPQQDETPVAEPEQEQAPFTFHPNGIASEEASAPAEAASVPEPAAEEDEAKEEPTPAEAAPEVPAPPSTVEEPAQPEPTPAAAPAVEEPQPVSAVEEKDSSSSAEPAAAPAPEAETKEEEPAAKAPEPAAAALAPAPAPASAPTPKSWASLAASNATKWGRTANESKGTSAAPPPAPVAAEPRAAASSSAAPGPAATQGPAFVEAVLAVRQPQCFVKGVLETVSDQLLRDTLTSRFGPLKEVDIVRSKACAFIEFEKLDHARRAIQASLRPSEGGEGGIMLPLEDGSSQRINVVERKPHSERPVSTRGRGGAAGAGAGAGEGRGAYGHKGAGGEGGRGGRGASQGARGARGGRGGRGGAAAAQQQQAAK